ncbi:MAG: GNAT family N-acetyltransferase [Candidatus Bathyarchaeota archaeon]|nr:GNAT family N-acetyltransferase [Candidatus Bathyarchaeota archaeon]
MKVSIKDITEDGIKEIPEPCRTCLYWEKPAFEKGRQKVAQTEKEKYATMKAAWFLKTLKEFGNCGKIIHADNKPVGYAQYSTSNRFPNVQEYGSKKLGTAKESIVFISCLYISDESFRGKNLGEKLLDQVIADLRKHGFKAVETFARKGSANNPSGPIKLYLRKGFHVEEEINSDFALVRLNL